MDDLASKAKEIALPRLLALTKLTKEKAIEVDLVADVAERIIWRAVEEADNG